MLKQQQRNLKVLISIGGATWSTDGNFDWLPDATARATFVSSAVQMLEDYGLDGMRVLFLFVALLCADSDLRAAVISTTKPSRLTRRPGFRPSLRR